MSNIRTVEWTVDKNLEVLPDAPQKGGVQGEDNATMVAFKLIDGCPLLGADYQLHIEYVDATGAWDCTEVLEVVDGRVSCMVPLAWTQHGGISTVRLVATAPDPDHPDQTGQTVYTLKGYLKFEYRDTAKRAEQTVVQTLIDTALEYVKTLKGDKGDPGDNAYGVAVKNGFVGTEDEWLASLKGNKGDPGDSVAVDAELSTESTNTVQNKVVAKAIADLQPVRFTVTKQGSKYVASKTFQELRDILAEDEHRSIICEVDGVDAPLISVITTSALLFSSTSTIWNSTTVQIANAGGEDMVSVYKGSHSITINGQLWDEDDPNADFTATINGMIDDKVAYVTPEMFGAKGDGVTDDTAAIQRAINTDKPCHLLGTYRIESPLQIIKNNQVLTIDGELRVYGDMGIVVNGSYNTITGGGAITMYSDNAVAIKRLVEGSNFGYSNEISVKSITNRHRTNNNIGVEITGSGNAGGACFDRITTTFALFRYGVWIHPAENQNASSWNTALYIDSVFNGCVQALVDEWESGGSFLHGQIQPLYKGDTRLPADFDENTPLVKVGSHWLIDAFFWDMNSSANKYAVKVTGGLNNITSHLSAKYFDIPVELRKDNAIKPFYNEGAEPSVAVAGSWSANTIGRYDNTNDILLNCIDNTTLTAKFSYDGVNHYALEPRHAFLNRPFDGDNTMMSFKGTIDGKNYYMEYLFEFHIPRNIRSIAVWGRDLPDAVTYEVAKSDSPEVFHTLTTLEAGKDYVRSAGGTSQCALWRYDGNNSTEYELFGGNYQRNISALKIKLHLSEGTQYNLHRISAFDVLPDIARRSGGEFAGDISFAQGTGVVLSDPNGVKYRLTVGTDGTLSAVAIK